MLHSVNLLPWREQLHQRRKHRFAVWLVIAVTVAIVIQWGGASYIQQQIQIQQSRLHYLDTYIAKLDKQIDDIKLLEKQHNVVLARLEVIDKLQHQRNKATEFMNALPHLIPEGVYLDKIKMHDQHVTVSGVSDMTSRLATMLDNLENTPYIRDVQIHSIIHDKTRFGHKFQTFSVSFSFVMPS